MKILITSSILVLSIMSAPAFGNEDYNKCFADLMEASEQDFDTANLTKEERKIARRLMRSFSRGFCRGLHGKK